MNTALRFPRLISTALVICLLLCLCACGEPAPEAGLYVLTEMRSDRFSLEPPESFLRLDTGGRGAFSLGEESGGLTWGSDGAGISLNINGRLFSASLEEGILRFQDEDAVLFVYVREDLAPAYLERLETERERRSELQEKWLGDWYGWWQLDQSEGSLADTWYDLCARFSLQNDGELYLTLWDEDQSAKEPMAELRLEPLDNGTLVPAEGYFWFTEPDENWVLGQTDGCIRLAGQHDGEGEQFDYEICLRPWGVLWEETEKTPYYYEDWYLPLIEKGKPMPERMTIK